MDTEKETLEERFLKTLEQLDAMCLDNELDRVAIRDALMVTLEGYLQEHPDYISGQETIAHLHKLINQIGADYNRELALTKEARKCAEIARESDVGPCKLVFPWE